jgi:hypothetical protein
MPDDSSFAGDSATANVKNVTKNQRVCAYADWQIIGPKAVRGPNCHDLHTNNRQMQAHWGLMN